MSNPTINVENFISGLSGFIKERTRARNEHIEKAFADLLEKNGFDYEELRKASALVTKAQLWVKENGIKVDVYSGRLFKDGKALNESFDDGN